MAELPTPWMEGGLFEEPGWESRFAGHGDGLRMMLCLPLLETLDERALPEGWLDNEIPAPVRTFLVRWEHGEVSVTGRGRLQLR